MKQSLKVALAASALAIAGGVFLVGTSFAGRGFGHHGGMMGPLAHEMLGKIDANSDGALSQAEIDAAIDARFAEFDANKDTNLSLTEFQALWAEITKPISVRAFQLLDPNGDASVAKAELDDRFGTLVAHFDQNDDGALSHEDRPHRRGWHGWGGDDQQ
jgi:hypothetical protein